MADLIDRIVKIEDVIDTLKQNGIIQDNEIGNLIVEEISRIPSADTERHAHWNKFTITKDSANLLFKDVKTDVNIWKCSNCNVIGSLNDKYCSNCGCKMDEEDKNE